MIETGTAHVDDSEMLALVRTELQAAVEILTALLYLQTDASKAPEAIKRAEEALKMTYYRRKRAVKNGP